MSDILDIAWQAFVFLSGFIIDIDRIMGDRKCKNLLENSIYK